MVGRTADSIEPKEIEELHLDINALNSWIWEASGEIIGSIRISRLKDLILPLIVYERLSDVFDDWFAEYVEEFGGDEAAKKAIEADHATALQEGRYSIFRYYIPDQYRWSAIRNHEADGTLGEFINMAIREVVEHNPDLQGVLDLWDYNGMNNGKRILDDSRLKALIEILSRYCMGRNITSDILDQTQEYFFSRFADTEVMYGDGFYTPKKVNNLIAKLIDPQQGSTIYDPFCGSGGLLIEAQRFIEMEYPEGRNKALQLYGENTNPSAYSMAKMNTILHGYGNFHLANGNALKNPSFISEDTGLMKFDYVTTNIPWNQGGYDEAFYMDDRLDRFRYGIPPNSSADWGWVQHIWSSLNETGKAAIVLDTGALLRGSKEKTIRKEFFNRDFIESIILLPENLSFGTRLPSVLILLNKNKYNERKGQFLLINASKYVFRNRSKNILTEEGIEAVLSVYRSWQARENFSWIVSLKYIKESDYEIDIAALSLTEHIQRMASRMGLENALSVSTVALEINLPKKSEPQGFKEYSNAVYIPKIGQSKALSLLSELTLKPKNYIQIVLNPDLARSEYVAAFFNSPLGLAIRRKAAPITIIPAISKKRLEKMQLYLPDLKSQQNVIEASSKIRNLTSELSELNQRLWLEPKNIDGIIRGELMKITRDDQRDERFIDWVNTLPFPLASILWIYHTSGEDHEKRYGYLLHFFEALSEFLATIMLSGIKNDEELFKNEWRKISEQFSEQTLSIELSSFGTWKMIIERFAKLIRTMSNKNPEGRLYCQDLFLTNDNQLLSLLSSKKVVGTLQEVNSLRNSWKGHGGIVSESTAFDRHEILKSHLTTIREAFGTVWKQYNLILPNKSIYSSGFYEYDVRRLMGEHSRFEIIKLKLEHPLEHGQLYLVSVDEQRALHLFPLLKVMKTKTMQDACYFYNRRDKGGLRFISYHFEAEPEIIQMFKDTDTIFELYNTST